MIDREASAYHLMRAQAEERRAEQATGTAAAEAHRQLARLHAERAALVGGGPAPRPVQPAFAGG